MYNLSRLKPRASKKTEVGSSRTMKIFFFFSPMLLVENRKSEDVYTFFLLFTILIYSVKTGHLRT